MKFLRIKFFFLIYFVSLCKINKIYSASISLGTDLFNCFYNFDRQYKYDGDFIYTLPLYPSFTFKSKVSRRYNHDLRLQLIYNKTHTPYAFGIILFSKKAEKSISIQKSEISQKFTNLHYSIFAHVLRCNLLMYNIYPYNSYHKTFYVCLGGNLSYCGEEKTQLKNGKPISSNITQEYKWYIWFNLSIIASYSFYVSSISTIITFDFLLFRIHDSIDTNKQTNNLNKKKDDDDTINVYCFGEVNNDSFQWLYPMPKLSIVFNFLNYTSDTEEKQIIN